VLPNPLAVAIAAEFEFEVELFRIFRLTLSYGLHMHRRLPEGRQERARPPCRSLSARAIGVWAGVPPRLIYTYRYIHTDIYVQIYTYRYIRTDIYVQIYTCTDDLRSDRGLTRYLV
jgi:hypothetical protein